MLSKDVNGDVVHNYHNFRPSEFRLLIAIAMAEVPTPNLLAISAIGIPIKPLTTTWGRWSTWTRCSKPSIHLSRLSLSPSSMCLIVIVIILNYVPFRLRPSPSGPVSVNYHFSTASPSRRVPTEL